jgi:hypothetical protein
MLIIIMLMIVMATTTERVASDCNNDDSKRNFCEANCPLAGQEFPNLSLSFRFSDILLMCISSKRGKYKPSITTQFHCLLHVSALAKSHRQAIESTQRKLIKYNPVK